MESFSVISDHTTNGVTVIIDWNFFSGLDSDYSEYNSDTESLNGSNIFTPDTCGESEESDNVEETPNREELSDDEDNLSLCSLNIRLEKETTDRNKVISWKQKSFQLNADQLRFSGDPL
ncbi:hypothetical protein QE152_g26894 [Popillia japonica]|uniref:Uncharacterized protein n=1 Tax=Popillia japonica TaxID=7064 RepID=A0AAW1JVG9_POPJA